MSTLMPPLSAFSFATPGAVLSQGAATTIILTASTVHLQAWVYVNGAGMPDNQKVFSIQGSLVLGIGTNGGTEPLLYPEVWDTAGNHYTFQQGVVPTDQWVLLEVVYVQGSALTGYINGVAVGSVAVGSNPIAKGSGDVILGSYDLSGDYTFCGMIQAAILTNAFGDSPTWVWGLTPDVQWSTWGPDAPTLLGATTVPLQSAPSTPFVTPPSPPSPTALNEQLPDATEPVTLLQMVVPTGTANTFTLLTLAQYWLNVANLTGQPSTTTSVSNSVTDGLTSSESTAKQFGVTIGVEAGFDLKVLSAKVNTTFSYTTTTTETVSITSEVTRTQQFSIENPPVATTAVWWQPVNVLTSTQYTSGSKSAKTVAVTIEDQQRGRLVATSYPGASAGTLRAVVPEGAAAK